MIRDELRDIEIDSEYISEYWYDQVYDDFPCVFPTISYELCGTNGLVALADAIRKEHGVLPLFDDSGEYNDVCWYAFYIDLNGYNKKHVDTCITVYVEPSDEIDDDFTSFAIDLSEEEQAHIYHCIDKCLSPESSCEQELQAALEYWTKTVETLTICDMA